MNLWTTFAAKLYPRWWRERYGEEFAALLEDARPGVRGFVDVLAGAISMRMNQAAASQIILAGALLGLTIAMLSISFWPPKFVSTATISSSREESARIIANWIESRLRPLIVKEGLYPAERLRNPMSAIVQRMKSDIQFILLPSSSGQGRDIRIAFAYPDRIVARSVVEDLTKQLLAADARSDPAFTLNLSLTERPSLPVHPVEPNRISIAGAGLGGGLAISALYAWLRARKRTPVAFK